MKTAVISFLLILPLAVTAQVRPRETTTNVVAPPVAAVPWTPQRRQAHQTEWYRVRLQTNTVTGKVRAFTNSFIELATGLNVPDGAGNFVPANSAFQITARGAEALSTGHKVLLTPNINSAGSVQVTKGDTVLKSHPLALGYYDPVDGRTVILSALRNSIGLLTAPNEVTYTNCFERIHAAIRYKNSLAGLAQDLILYESPPAPEELGLSSESRLELFTEFLPDTPAPQMTSRVIYREDNTVKRTTMLEPDFEDATLTFNNSMRMGPGRAFSLPSNTRGRTNLNRTAPVGKWFGVIDQRPILIEGVQHRRIRTMLTNLPPARISGELTNAAIKTTFSNLLAHSPARQLPRQPSATQTSESIQMASARTKTAEPAFVLDYELLENGYEENFKFESTSTYLVRGYFGLGGTTRISPGTVVKYDRDSWLEIYGPIECDTEAYKPAVFTAVSDESVGEKNLPGSEGSPNGIYALVALYITTANSDLKHLRITYADTAIMAYYGGTHTISHSQILHGYNAIYGEYATFNIRNMLVQDVSVVFLGGYSSFQVEHLTAHQGYWLAYDYYGNSCSLNLINTLVVSVPDNGMNYSQTQLYLNPPENPPIFQTVGSGSHYLSDNRFRGVGTPNIEVGLRAAMKTNTTHAPSRLTGPITTDTTLGVTATRNSEANPDIGYAYPAIDYLISGLTIPNVTLTITNGSVVAVDFSAANYGMRLNSGKLISQGSPLNPNRIVWANAVQENPMPAGNSWAHTFEDGYLGTSPAPEAHFRFTSLSQLAGSYYHFYGGNYLNKFVMRDSEIFGGKFSCTYYGSVSRFISWTNNAFINPNIWIHTFGPTWVNAYNNTFVGGTINFINDSGSMNYWIVRDNIFDNLFISDNYLPLGNSHNYTRDLQPNSHLANSDPPRPFMDSFVRGALGDFYLPSGTTLADVGSRSASEAGLAHYTIREEDQQKDAGNVAIGAHYIALNQSGQPIDSDGDGIPDYLEDNNGNGIQDNNETSFTKADSDFDGLPDGYEVTVTQTSPTLADTGNTGYSDGQKDSDNDGLTNLEEFKSNTNPWQADVIPPRLTPSGGAYLYPQTVRIYCSTEGATIRYTMNGTEPNEFSQAIVSGSELPSQISAPATIKAKAWKSGLTTSKTTIANYAFAVGTPTFYPGGGIYGAGEEIFIYEATPGSMVRYTTDGNEPTLINSTEYTGSAIILNATATLKARAWQNGMQSGVASALYTIRAAPANDLFANRQTLTGMSGVVRGSNLGAGVEAAEDCYYFLNHNLDIYSSVWFQWTAPSSGKIAFDTGTSDFDTDLSVFTGTDFTGCFANVALVADNGDVDYPRDNTSAVSFDAVTGQSYKIVLFTLGTAGNYVLRWYPLTQTAKPIISNPGGTFRTAQTAIISCDTPRAIIRYTTDGNEPSEQSQSMLNGTSISITRSITLKARAWRNDAMPSDTATASFVIDPSAANPTPVVATPSATPPESTFITSLNVVLNCATPGVLIHYTLDGTVPLESSASVGSGGSIMVSQSTRLKFRAFKSGLNPSSIVIALFAKENTDTDYDGIPDTWEKAHGSDIFVSDAHAISDEPFAHGLDNLQVYGNPSVLIADNYSTLADGIPDWWKVKYGYSITDPSVATTVGANGMTAQDNYQQVRDPTNPSSRPDMLEPPNDWVIRRGPQNHLYLILHRLPAGTSRVRLYVTDYVGGPEFSIDYILPLPPPQALLIPPSRLINRYEYAFEMEAQDSDGRVSPRVSYSSGAFPIEFVDFSTIDFRNDLRDLVQWRLKAIGSTPWLTSDATPGTLAYYQRVYWRYISLPSRAQEGWGDSFFAQPFPRASTSQEVDIGDFVGLTWAGPQTYPLPDAGLFVLDGWDLRNSGLTRTDILQNGQLKHYFNWPLPSQNLFGLQYTSFRLGFADTTVTLTPGSSVEVSQANAYNNTARAYQSVEEASTTVTTHLFNYRSSDWGQGAPLGYPESFFPYPVTFSFPLSPGVNEANATAVENPNLTMNVEETVRVNGWSKEQINRAGGQPIQGQFVYVQQYFDKAFVCDDVTGDVPRTTEDNVGGKKKINVALAVQSGLLSPYGDFTPTNTGKYILTTMPDANGKYGECTVYVLPTEIVTRDPDEGVERPLDDTIYTSSPAPDVTLNLLSATINSSGALQIQVSARVVDRLSEVADDPAERLQQLKFILNGEEIDVVENLPALSPGSGVLPWQPYRLDVTIPPRTYTVPNPGGGAFVLRAETSENAVGNVGWDEVAVGVGLDTLPFATGTDPITLAFSQAPTTTAVDSFQIYFGDRAPQASDPACSESAANSWLFNGSISVSGSLRPCQVQIFGGVAVNSGAVDSFDAEVTYQLQDGSSRTLLGTFTESAPTSLRFVNSFSASAITVPAVWHTEQREGSPKGSFDPILVRFSAPNFLVDDEDIYAAMNDVRQPVAPFTFSPQKYYLVARGDETRPRLVVVTVQNLPPGLNALTPENLRVTEQDGEFKIQVQHEGRDIADARTEVFKDDFHVERRLFGWVQAPITLPALLSYYKLLYKETGQKLLNYVQLGGGVIELGDVVGDVDVDWRPGPVIAIQIEEDVDPVTAASYLWTGLRRASAFKFIRDKIEEYEDLDLFLDSLAQVGSEATRVGTAGANVYLSGLSIVNEGADLALTLNDLSEGHYAAAIGLLPFVPSGARYIWKKADGTVLHTFTKEVADRIAVALGKPTRLERLENLRQAIQEGLVTPEMMKAFIEGRYVPRYSSSYNRKLLREQLEIHVGPAPTAFHQAHHDLPVEEDLIEQWLKRGLDPNKAEHGRWVKKTIKGSGEGHQVWSREFAEEWRRWLAANPNATADDVLAHMYELRGDARFQ